MDRYAELQKLVFEAKDNLQKVLANAKAEGRTEDTLTQDEVEEIEKYTGLHDEYTTALAELNRRREALRKMREVTSAPAEPDDPAAEETARRALPGHAVTTGLRHASEADKEQWGWQSFGHQARAIKEATVSGGFSVDEKLRVRAATGASRLTGPDGGWAIAPAFETRIWKGVMESSPLNLISQCDQRTITGKSLTLNANAETSRADGSRHGGTRAYWMNEGGTLTASRPTLRQLTLQPHKLAVLSYMTDELLEDATALDQELSMSAMDEIRYVSNRAIVRGSGAGQPKGIITGTAGTTSPRITVTVETGQTSNEPLLAANIDKMWSRLWGYCRPNSVWLINQELEPYLQAIGREVGVSGIPAYMPPGGLSASPYATLKGRPVVPCEWCSAANTEGDIILADLRGYLVGTKGGIRTDSSIHVQFVTDEVAFRFIFRIDGQPWRLQPVTMEFGSTFTVSEFVTLGTRS